MPISVFLSHPRDIRAITTAPPDVLHSGAGGMLMAPLFGESAFVLRNGEEHAAGREAVMPAFHNKRVQGHTDLVAEIVENEIASWPIGSEFPLLPYLDRLTLMVMLTTSIASRKYIYETLCRRMIEMLSVMSSPLLQEPRLRRLPGWHGMWGRFLRHRDGVDEIVLELIAERRRESFESGNGNGNGRDSESRDMIDMLLAASNPDGSPMSDRQVRDNLMAVVIAGHETTSSTLAWTFQLLAHNPAVQDRLIAEIDAGSGRTGAGVDRSLAGSDCADARADRSDAGSNRDDAGSDDYMNATIQEAMRHKPTFLFLPPRVVMQPVEIGGFCYRPPTQLLACIYLMHHDPEIHPSPHTFMPERFLTGGPPPGTLMPWGGGRKRCPGRSLALMEIRTVLRQALSRWLVLSAGEHIERPRWRTALLVPHDGSKVILRERHSHGRPGATGSGLKLERSLSI